MKITSVHTACSLLVFWRNLQPFYEGLLLQVFGTGSTGLDCTKDFGGSLKICGYGETIATWSVSGESHLRMTLERNSHRVWSK